MPDDSNKIQALFYFSVADFETWLGFKIRSRAIGKRLRLPSEPLLNNFSIGKWLSILDSKSDVRHEVVEINFTAKRIFS